MLNQSLYLQYYCPLSHSQEITWVMNLKFQCDYILSWSNKDNSTWPGSHWPFHSFISGHLPAFSHPSYCHILNVVTALSDFLHKQAPTCSSNSYQLSFLLNDLTKESVFFFSLVTILSEGSVPCLPPLPQLLLWVEFLRYPKKRNFLRLPLEAEIQ